jgi:hypothetical protein
MLDSKSPEGSTHSIFKGKQFVREDLLCPVSRSGVRE